MSKFWKLTFSWKMLSPTIRYQIPELTKNAYHTFIINPKFFFIHFHTISYVQKFVWNLYNECFSINGNCTLGVFFHKPKSYFLFLNWFPEKFWVVFATEHNWQRPWLLKAPKVAWSYIYNAKKNDLNCLPAVFHNWYRQSNKF